VVFAGVSAFLLMFPAVATDSAGAPKAMEGIVGSLARMADGRLLNWRCDGPETKTKAYGRFSSDEGETWSEEVELFQFPAEKGSYGTGMPYILDKHGTLHLFGLHYIGEGPEGFYKWEECESYIYHVMTSDNGKTWSPVQHCDFGKLYTGAVNSAIELSSDRLLAPLSYYSKRKTGKFVSNLSISDDGGKTWRPSKGEVAVDTGGHLLEGGSVEPVVVELSDGRVWMVIRTQSGYHYESFSSDGGDTWSAAAPTRFVASNAPAGLLRLRDGRLLLVWNNCLSPYDEGNILTSYDRWVLSAAVSADDGKTWQGYREVMGVHGEERAVGYPHLIELNDGRVVCQAVRNVEFSPDWLLETAYTADFEAGLKDWMTLGSKGVGLVPHPDDESRNILTFDKPDATTSSAASFNFPFGPRGSLKMRVMNKADDRWIMRQHYYFSLADFYNMPTFPAVVKGNPPGGWHTQQSGALFVFRFTPEGELSVATRRGIYNHIYEKTGASIGSGEWHEIELRWDCGQGICDVLLDGEKVGQMQQLHEAPGACYLRMWMNDDVPEPEGMLIESIEVSVEPEGGV